MSDQRRCPTCRAAVRERDRYCSYCHVRLADDERPSEPGEAPALEAQPVVSPVFLDDAPARTGQGDLVEAATKAFGTEPTLIPGRTHVSQFALWHFKTPKPHVVVLTLGFSQLDTAPYEGARSGFGFEYLCRVEGLAPPEWVLTSLDSNEGDDHRLVMGSVLCDLEPAPEFGTTVATINGGVDVLEAVSPRGGLFSAQALTAPDSDVEDAFLENPESPQFTQVFRDHLEAHGDARATVFSDLGTEHDSLEEWVGARSRFGTGHDDHTRRPLSLFGPLIDHVSRGDVFDLVVEHGLLRELSVRAPRTGNWWGPPRVVESLAELTWGLLALPLTRWLRGLQLAYEVGDPPGFEVAVKHVCAGVQAKHLRRLGLGLPPDGRGPEIGLSEWGDLSRLSTDLPRLEDLLVHTSADVTWSSFAHQRLRRFTRESDALDVHELRSLTRARWPALEHLEVWVGSAHRGVTVDDFGPWLTGVAVPRVTSFGLVNAEIAASCVSELARSALVKQLRRLDLSRGDLADADVDTLVQCAPSFSHLDEVDLRFNRLSPEAAARVQAVLPRALVSAQLAQRAARYDPVDE